MSQEERDQITGRIFRECKELKQKIAELKAKAADQGDTLVKIGRLLSSSPELLAFDDASSGVTKSMLNVQSWKQADYPSLQEIFPIGNELRETMERLRRKEEEAQKLGITSV